MEDERRAYRRRMRKRYHFARIAVHGRIILKFIFKKRDGARGGSVD
jgi:hypothetical protein